jgi:hypothetical protein
VKEVVVSNDSHLLFVSSHITYFVILNLKCKIEVILLHLTYTTHLVKTVTIPEIILSVR